MTTKAPNKTGRPRQPQAPSVRRTYAGRLGRKLADLADARQITADDLAKAIGKSGDSVRLYFAGQATPHVNDWPRLAAALHVTIRELLPE
jgi:transcriptional regulator with XRE-family HTH domain